MQLQFRDYNNINYFNNDKDANFNSDGAYTHCASGWQNDDSIRIEDTDHVTGKFSIRGNNDGWTIGCQKVFAIINDEHKLIYVTPHDSIYVSRSNGPDMRDTIRERLLQVHEDLVKLLNNNWLIQTEEEIENIEFIDNYMPDVF